MSTIISLNAFDLASVSANISAGQGPERESDETNLTQMLKAPRGFVQKTLPSIIQTAREKSRGVSSSAFALSSTKRTLSPTRDNFGTIVTPNMYASRLAARSGSPDIEDTTNAFVIHNLLTPVECEYVIATAEPHMSPLDHLYAQKTRKADRAMIHSSVVAGQLYRRILPLLGEEKDYATRSLLCFGHDGVWVPLGLNECLKVFRYTPGGMFVPHRDSPWVSRQDQCSMYTVVIYLNDDFLGGSTVLAGSHAYCGPQGCRDFDWENRNTMSHMVPMQGSALLFNHDCWHAEHPMLRGRKWILRTELIFQRVHSFYVDRNAFSSEEQYREARALYDASMAASAAGDRDAFFDKYQQVVRMQRAAMLREEACRAAMLLPRLGLEELSGVLSFLPVREVGQLMRLNRGTYCAIRQAPLWQDLWAADVRRGGVPAPADLVDDRRERAMLGPIAAISSALGGWRCPVDEGNLSLQHGHGDYFGLCRQRVWMRRQFTPAALLLLDSGAAMATPVPLVKRPDNKHRYLYAYRPTFTPMGLLDANSLPANVVPDKASLKSGKCEVFHAVRTALESARGFGLARAERYCGDWMCVNPHYRINQPSYERLLTSDRQGPLKGAKPIVDPTSGAVEWSVLCTAVDQYVETADTPLIVVTHPTWHPADLTAASRGDERKAKEEEEQDTNGLVAKCRAAADALFELCSVPAVGFCHPAVCAAIGCETACPDVSPRDGGRVLTIEMRYGYTLSEATDTASLRLPPQRPTDVVRYVYRVDTETMAVVGGVCVRGDEAVPESFVADVVLVDCNVVPCTDDDWALRECGILASVKATGELHVRALAEVLGYGVRAVSACPAVFRCLLFRVQS